jgi:hypothetical protein
MRRLFSLLVLAISISAAAAFQEVRRGVYDGAVPRLGYTTKTAAGNVPVLVWSTLDNGLTVDVLREQDEVRRVSGRKVDRQKFLKAAAQESLPILVSSYGTMFHKSWLRMFDPDVYVVILKREYPPPKLTDEPPEALPPILGYTVLDPGTRTPMLTKVTPAEKALQEEVQVMSAPSRPRELRTRRVPWNLVSTLKIGSDVEVQRIDGRKVEVEDLVADAKQNTVAVVFPADGKEIDARWRKMFRPETLVIISGPGNVPPK